MFTLIRRRSSYLKQVFTGIYRDNHWGDPESVSGPGSTLERTSFFAPRLMDLLKRLDINHLLDAGCGDFNWLKHLDLDSMRYTGVDVVGEIINANKRFYGNHRRRFIHADLTSLRLPKADLILCRDCLVHLPFKEAQLILKNFRESSSQYLLTTTFIERRENHDVEAGSWRPLNLQLAPFTFPEPLELIREKPLDPQYHDKRLGLWELQSEGY